MNILTFFNAILLGLAVLLNLPSNSLDALVVVVLRGTARGGFFALCSISTSASVACPKKKPTVTASQKDMQLKKKSRIRV